MNDLLVFRVLMFLILLAFMGMVIAAWSLAWLIVKTIRNKKKEVDTLKCIYCGKKLTVIVGMDRWCRECRKK